MHYRRTAHANPGAARRATKQRPTRQRHMGERGLKTKSGFLEPCRAEKNKGSNMQAGLLEHHCPSFVALRGFAGVCCRSRRHASVSASVSVPVDVRLLGGLAPSAALSLLIHTAVSSFEQARRHSERVRDEALLAGVSPVSGKNKQSKNSTEETPKPRRDSKKTRRHHVYDCLCCVLSPCFLGVSSWVWSLCWGI